MSNNSKILDYGLKIQDFQEKLRLSIENLGILTCKWKKNLDCQLIIQNIDSESFSI